MDYQNNMNSKREAVHPIIIWIIASILFHLLLTLGIITLKISSLPLKTPQKIQEEHAILMMDEPKKQQNIQPPAPQASQKKEVKKEQKQEKKEEPKLKWSDYRLVPGRQGINKQNLDDPANLLNLPKPEEQKLTKKSEKKESAAQEKKLQKPQESVSSDSDFDSKQKENVKAEELPTKNNSKPLTSFADQDQKKSSIKEKLKKEFRTPIAEQDPYEFVPQPTRIVSFQDLNLGFDNHYATVGNTSSLIQSGITNLVPDGASLKHLTYFNQCADMMKTAIRTHPQLRLCQHINTSGMRFYFTITIDRQGKQLEFKIRQGSGNIIVDRILQESLTSIRMFPKMPTFIPDSPFAMKWTLLL